MNLVLLVYERDVSEGGFGFFYLAEASRGDYFWAHLLRTGCLNWTDLNHSSPTSTIV